MKCAQEVRNHSTPKVNCGFPQHMLNCLWTSTGISLIFTMETNTILRCMHTHWGSNCHGIQRRSDYKLSETRQIHSTPNWTLSQASVCHSMSHSRSYSLLLYCYVSSVNFFCHEPEELPFISSGQGLAVLSRSGSWLSGDRGKKKLCRDPERCPEMKLNRHHTHARIHHHYQH